MKNNLFGKNAPKGFFLTPQATNEVKCRGQALAPILWQGEQWAVTEYGLERRDGTYAVKAGDHFWNGCGIGRKNRDEQTVFSTWWRHLSQKSWCDEDDIDAALQAMLVLFDESGKRTNVKAPSILSEYDAEDFALQAGEAAYKDAKQRAIEGLV